MTSSTSWLQLGRRTAVITGASSGIGKSISKALFRQNCNVVLADINESQLYNTAQELSSFVHNIDPTFDESNQRSPTIRSVPCNVVDPKEVQRLISIADEIAKDEERMRCTNCDEDEDFKLPGRASILVNCAGITKDSFVSKMEVDDFDSVINVNLKGTFLTCKYFCEKKRLDSFKSVGNSSVSERSKMTASIINIGSVVGSYGNIGQSNYAASKGGVTSFTRSIAKEVAQFGVRANVILPGFIETPMINTVPEKVLSQLKENNLVIKRFGSVDDVADLCLFLSSERSGYITGQAIECSGMISL